MWVYTRSSFLSIVSDANDPAMVVVRGRIAGDVQRLWPSAQVQKTPARDYAYRARINRGEVGEALKNEIVKLTYENFKQAAGETDRRRSPFLAWIWRETAEMGEKLDAPKRR